MRKLFEEEINSGAVEFLCMKMSSENRLQIQNLLDDVWLNMTYNIKESRKFL